MSLRRCLMTLALLALGAVPAAAQDVIRVQVGGELAARVNEELLVPVTVDMTGAPGRLLGGYRLRIQWDPTVLSFSNVQSGNFAPVNYGTNFTTDSIGQGVARVTAIQPSGSPGLVTLFSLRLYPVTDTVTSAITLTLDDLTQAGTFADLLPFAQVTNGAFCRALGRWGDTNGDGRSDSRDALIALSRVVGLIDTLRIDTVSVSPLVVDTIRTRMADVDADGQVTSRDALIILSHAVGLPVTGFRIGILAAGACATGSAASLLITPDTLELEVNQEATIMVQALDASGRVVPATGLVWRTSDATVAAQGYVFQGGDLRAGSPAGTGLNALTAPVPVHGRGPGTAVLTAEIGPGVRDSLVIHVVARRRVWHANVRTALGAATQTGTTRYPFGRLQDALYHAQDGDTIRVAPGTYPETAGDYQAVAILGDPAERPILDARAAPSFNPGNTALYFGNASGKATLAHLIVRGGSVYLEGHHHEVRSVRIDELPANAGRVLEVYSHERVTGTEPATGPPGTYGNVLIDSLEITARVLNSDAIVINTADTLIVRNSTVAADSVPQSCFARGLEAFDASLSLISNNTFSNVCQGIYLDHSSEVGRAVLSRNRISGVRRVGIEVRAPVVRLDHNVIRDLVAPHNYYGGAIGVYIPYYGQVDSLSLLGDSIVNSGNRGVWIDSARITTIDSLTVSGTGRDSSFNSHGVEFQRGHLTLRHSRIHDVINGHGVYVCDRSGVTSRGNRVRDVTYNGFWVSSCSEGPGLDSLRMARDTVINAGADGIAAHGVRRARIDSVVVDSTAFVSLRLSGFDRAEVLAATLRRGQDGVLMTSVDTFALSFSRIELMGNYGVLMNVAADTARLTGNTIDAAFIGIHVANMFARLDSNRVVNHLNEGLMIQGGAGVRVTRSRFQGNALGVHMAAGALPSFINRSIIAGNIARQGVSNVSGVLLNADTVYWGDPGGPACAGCGTSAGDSVLTPDVSFADPLASPDAAIPAPPVFSGVRWTPRVSPPVRPRPAGTPAIAVPQDEAESGRRRIPKSVTDPRPRR